jgi:hypothetical protein
LLIVEYAWLFSPAPPPSPSIYPPNVCCCAFPTGNIFFALSRSGNYSSGGGRTPKPSARAITHGVGMTPMRWVGAS